MSAQKIVIAMKTYSQQPETVSHTIQGKNRTAKQADMHSVLQKYAIAQRAEMPDEDELLQGKFDVAQREELDDEEPLQGKFEAAQREENSTPNLTGIPDQTKENFENLSGFSFDDVRVHYNSPKPAQLQALAYTQGSEVHIAPGQEKHLGHELGHVVQQKQGRVQPTMQLQGVNVNDNEGLEREADGFAKATCNNSECRNIPLKTNINIYSPIQRYATFVNEEKVYNISNTGQFICGLEYPNHELYVLNKDKITSKDDSMIEFVSGETKQFPRLNSEYGKKNYTKILPKWKKEYDFSNKRLITSFKNLNDRDIMPDNVNIEWYNKLNIVRKSSENLRKFFTQLQFKWTSQYSQFEHVYYRYKLIYIQLNEMLYATNDERTKEQNNLPQELLTLKEELELILQPLSFRASVFDNNSEMDDIYEMYEPIVTNIVILASNLQQILTISNRWLEKATKEAFIYEQTQNKDIKMPRGCDLVAALFGKYKDEGTSNMLNFTVKKSDKHHYATVILEDSGDYITLEGFAKKGYTGVDDHWEFFMHGHFRPGIEQAFTDYTKIRYTYFNEFKDGVEANTMRVLSNSQSSIIEVFMNKYYNKND